MPGKVDFHTEWAMPDPASCEDVENEERRPHAPMTQASAIGTRQAAQAPQPQTGEKWLVAGGPAY
jgi:hypothetical protein